MRAVLGAHFLFVSAFVKISRTLSSGNLPPPKDFGGCGRLFIASAGHGENRNKLSLVSPLYRRLRTLRYRLRVLRASQANRLKGTICSPVGEHIVKCLRISSPLTRLSFFDGGPCRERQKGSKENEKQRIKGRKSRIRRCILLRSNHEKRKAHNR